MDEASTNATAARKLSGRLLVRNATFNLAGQLLPMVVAVLAIPVIVRSLGTDRFGVLTLAWMVAVIIDTPLYFSIFYRLSPVKSARKPVLKLIVIIWSALMIAGAFAAGMTAGIYMRFFAVLAGIGLSAIICWVVFPDEGERDYLCNMFGKLRMQKAAASPEGLSVERQMEHEKTGA